MSEDNKKQEEETVEVEEVESKPDNNTAIMTKLMASDAAPENVAMVAKAFDGLTPDQKVEVLMHTVIFQATESAATRRTIAEMAAEMKRLTGEMKDANNMNRPRGVNRVNTNFADKETVDRENAEADAAKKRSGGSMRFG